MQGDQSGTRGARPGPARGRLSRWAASAASAASAACAVAVLGTAVAVAVAVVVPVGGARAAAAVTPTDWTLSVLAGNGTRSSPSTSGPATSSAMGFRVSGVAVDEQGSTYLAEMDRGSVLRVDPAGDIHVLAGIRVSAGYKFSADPLAAWLRAPTGVAVRGGEVFFTDSGRVLRISGGRLSEVAGGGAATPTTVPAPATSVALAQPGHLAFNAQGDLFIAEETGNRVLQLSGGQLRVVAGGGATAPTAARPVPATSASLNVPRGLVVDADDDLLIANSSGNQVLRLHDGQLSVVVGTGLRLPFGIAVDDAGTLYVADYGHSVVKAFSGSAVSTIAGTSSGSSLPTGRTTPTPGPATGSALVPGGLAVTADRTLLLGDYLSPYAYRIAAPTPVRPGAVSATAGDAEATVTWTPPASPGSSAVTGYVVTPVEDGVALAPRTVTGAATTLTLTGLRNGRAHTFRVAALNTAGAGPAAVSASAVTPSPRPVLVPGAPTGVTAVAGDGAAVLSWGAPVSDGGAPVTGYLVTPFRGGAAQPPLTAGPTATGLTVPGLTNGAAHTFTVVALNSAGAGPPGTSAPVTPVAPVAPPAGPTGLLVQTVEVSAPDEVPLSARTARVVATASAGGALSYASSDQLVAGVDAAGVLELRAPGTTTVTVRAAATGTHGPATASTAVSVTASADAAPPAGVTRLGGEHRVATSVAVSQRIFPAPTAGVVVATSAQAADSIAGARLAGHVQGPLLLTGAEGLDAAVAGEVRRLLGLGGTVYLLGGEEALPAGVQDALAASSGVHLVQRVGGTDRYATAVAVADVVTSRAGDLGPIYVVTGEDPGDGGSVSAHAQRSGGVVLLTAGERLPAPTARYLRAHDPAGVRTVPVGGAAARALARGGFTAAAGRAVVGPDRYATSALLAERHAASRAPVAGQGAATSIGVAGGASWPDALAGAAAMSHLDGPLLLTKTGSPRLVGPTARALGELGPTADRAVVFGGGAAVSDAAMGEVKGLVPGRGPTAPRRDATAGALAAGESGS